MLPRLQTIPRHHLPPTIRFSAWLLVAAWLGIDASLAVPTSAAETRGAKTTASAESAASDAAPKSASRLANPVVQLARDPRVQAELKLNANQVDQLNDRYAKIERELWPLRDAQAGPGAEKLGKLADQFEQDLADLLDPEQLLRMRQLLVQAQGWQSLTAPRIAGELKLSQSQRRQIEQIVTTTAARLEQLAAGSLPAAEREAAAVKLRREEGTSIQKLLTAAQRKQLAGLVGAKFDLSDVRALTFTAPPLGQIDRWVNSQPLQPADVKGKVVAFHFWAFGCINCIRNLPHYNQWHEQFAPRGLIVWGMHTPETKAEHDLAALERKVAEYKILYPVSADHDNQNWNAWANYLWPSVYLVDKRGVVRYWWYGELNWQGAEGEKFMRQKIEELLAEPE